MLRKSVLAILLSLSLIFFVVGCNSSTSETSEADTDVKEVEMDDTTDDMKTDDDSLVGTWRAEGVVEDGTTTIDMTFGSDGTFTIYEVLSAGQPGEGIDEQEDSTSTGHGTYTTDGDKLTVTYDSISSDGVTYDGQKLKDDLDGQSVDYTYELDGDDLKLTDKAGDTETLTRTKPE